jgi:hypothetical protein
MDAASHLHAPVSEDESEHKGWHEDCATHARALDAVIGCLEAHGCTDDDEDEDE